MAEWQMAPAVAAGLERLGWRADEPQLRDVIPAIMRGGNAVVVLPPTPAWAGPVLAALLGREAGSVLILASPASLGEWALAVGALVEGTELQVAVAREGETTRLRPCTILIASPESALERHAQSAFHPEQFHAVVFAWPEQWRADDAVTAILQDIPKDAQRVVLTAQRDQLDAADSVVERYARKALVLVPTLGVTPAGSPPLRPMSVRTVATQWRDRSTTLTAVVASVDSAHATIWTADDRDHQLIRRTLGSLRHGLFLLGRAIPPAGTVICYDLPSPQQLTQLSAVGEVILLVPPGCEQYVARVAPTRRPMQLAAPATAVVTRDTVLRQAIARELAGPDASGALYALAPLFEVHDPQDIAAALFSLWRREAAGKAAAVPAAPHTAVLAPAQNREGSGASANAAVAKIWIGAGKKDDATVADFVAVLVREVGVERSRIGRIELRDTFAIVEVPAADAEAIVMRLSGITIRKRKLTARLDQGVQGRRAAQRGGP